MQQVVMTSTANEDTDRTYISWIHSGLDKRFLNMKVSNAISLFQILFLPVLCF